jgi:hypothetical protein
MCRRMHVLYPTPNIIRTIKSKRMKCVGIREYRNAFRILVGKPGRKRPLGKQT